MKRWLRRIRGTLGMGLIWAVAWSLIGALLAVLPGVNPPGFPRSLEWILGSAAQYAAMGFVGGATFSVVFGLFEGRRRFDQMSLPRFAVWGSVGGLMMWAASDAIGHSVMYLLWSVDVPSLVVTGAISAGVTVTLGAGSAAGSLALARNADKQDLLESGEDVTRVGLTDKEVRELM